MKKLLMCGGCEIQCKEKNVWFYQLIWSHNVNMPLERVSKADTLSIFPLSEWMGKS